jgi:hypothetical protein
VFAELLKQRLRRVSDKIDELGMPLKPFTCNWFLCLFIHTVPLETTLRIWDALFAGEVRCKLCD